MSDIIEKYKLNRSTWTYKGFHGVLHTFFPVGQNAFLMKEFFGDSSKVVLFMVENDYVHWYWNNNDLARIREKFLLRLKKDKNYLKNLINEWKKSIKEFDLIISRVQKIDLSKLSNEKLAVLYDEFYHKYIAQFKYFMVIGDAVSMQVEDYLVPELEKALGDEAYTYFPKLITTSHKSFIEQEQEDRKHLIDLFRRKGKIEQEKLNHHSSKYFYINNNYAKADYLTGNDFKKLIIANAENDDDKIKENENPTKQRDLLIKKLRLTDWQINLLYMIDDFFGIQDTRKKYVLISNHYQFRFLREASRRTGIPFESLQYSVYPEFKKVLNNRISIDELNQRKRVCVCIQTSLDDYQILIGKEAEEVKDFFFHNKKVKNELKGMIASPGRAKGRVKVVLKIHDMINMEEGDVLVASMTRPEMISAMKKASAIVTDEGGITSHAAIVSRELGVPCIIGTQDATKILKDGDLVEVDAENGLVRRVDE